MTIGSLVQFSGVVVDLIYRIDHRPETGGEAEAHKVLITAGGGFNAMVAAKRIGIAVSYGGALGTGLFAEIAERALHAEDIPILARHRHSSDQGTCVVMLEASGERTFITHHGAERKPDHRDVLSLAETHHDWALLSGYSLMKVSSASELLPLISDLPATTKFLFDPGPIIGSLSPETLGRAMGRADWVSANDREAAVMTGADDPAAGARMLATGRQGAVVRQGAAGCWLSVAGEAAQQIEGMAVEPIDTSGAGDAHVGAFIGALCRGFDPRSAAQIANGAAALKTTRFGPATSPDLQETLDFLRRRGVDMSI